MEMRFFNVRGIEIRKNPRVIESYDDGWHWMISHFNRHPNGYLMMGERFAFALGQGDALLWNAFNANRGNPS